MSLLNDASLVLIPSGYKEDKVYSIIPSDGSGDLDFVRGSDGTRINSLGQVENVCWNLAQYSEDFTNGFWNKADVSVSANQAVAPNGTTTADKIISSSTNNEHLVYYFESNYLNQVVTLSGYVKKVDYRYAILRSYTNSSYRISVFDLDNGTIVSQDLGSSVIESVGNGWYRISTTYTTPGGLFGIQFGFSPTTIQSYLGNGTSGNYLWGAQLNIGTLKPYFPTTDRLNVPRLTYSPTLIERQSTNLVKYSEQFDNGVWTTPNGSSSVIITPNVITAPNGTLTADKLEIQSGYANRIEQVGTAVGLTVGSPCTFSCYIKSISGTGVVGIRSGVSGMSSTFTYNNEWQRVSWTFNAAATNEIPQFCNDTLAGGADSAPSFYIWGAQLEAGSLTSYIPTTSTAVTRVASYNSGCPSLLLEKQSTNLALYSEQFDNANWSKLNSSISANVVISPDGTQNADKIIEDNTLSGHTNYQAVNVSIGSSYTLSVFAKAAERSKLWLDFFGGANLAVFDLSNGTVITSTGSGLTAKIENYNNGWYRCIITQNAVSPTLYVNFGPTINTNTIPTYQGNGTSGIYIWGAQLEASSYPTSYIPTTSATVTRLADSCYKTGISSLIGQTEGTMFIEVTDIAKREQGRYLFLSDATFTNRIVIYQASGNLNVYCSAGSAFNMTYSIPSGRSKIAFGYKSGLYSLFVNGIERATNTLSSIPANLSAFGIGSNEGNIGTPEPLDSSVSQTLLFKRRLTNTELANLTTL